MDHIPRSFVRVAALAAMLLVSACDRDNSAAKPAPTASFAALEVFGMYRMTSYQKSAASCAELGANRLDGFREPFFIVGPPHWGKGKARFVTCSGVDECKKKQKEKFVGAARMAQFEYGTPSGLTGAGYRLYGTKTGDCESSYEQYSLGPSEGGLRVELRTARFHHPLGANGMCQSNEVLKLGPDKPCTNLEVFVGQRVSAEASQTGSIAPTPVRPNIPAKPAKPAARQVFGAAHILVSHKGSMRAKPDVTRTKEEAKRRATEITAKAKKDPAKFGDLAKEFSDESSGTRGGELGQFPRGRMHPKFQAGLEKAEVGGVVGPVETPFGYHVIKRTK